MQEAKVGDQLVRADSDSPEKAQCPTCGATVVKRKRRRMDGGFPWFYRHVRGKGKEDCAHAGTAPSVRIVNQC